MLTGGPASTRFVVRIIPTRLKISTIFVGEDYGIRYQPESCQPPSGPFAKRKVLRLGEVDASPLLG